MGAVSRQQRRIAWGTAATARGPVIACAIDPKCIVHGGALWYNSIR
jgi:hypothetical protein